MVTKSDFLLISRPVFVKRMQWELISLVEGRLLDQFRKYSPKAWYRKEIKELMKWRYYDELLDCDVICYETGEYAPKWSTVIKE